MLIWQKHILKKLCGTFLFFLACLLAIYTLVDLSAHGARFLSKSHFKGVLTYYFMSFSSLLDLFFTLAFLFAAMRVLYDLNSHREILALQMAGLSKKKLLLPLFLFGFLLSLIGYANIQWIAPEAQEVVGDFRQKEAHMEKIESFPEKTFLEIRWDKNTTFHRTVPYECRSLSTLLTQGLSDSSENRILFSHFFYKCIGPLMPLLALLTIGPSVLELTRKFPFFLIAAYSIFRFVSLKVVLDGMLILGENQVLPSYVAIFGPVVCVLCFRVPTFIKMH